jgi:hypothetical protein
VVCYALAGSERSRLTQISSRRGNRKKERCSFVLEVFFLNSSSGNTISRLTSVDVGFWKAD